MDSLITTMWGSVKIEQTRLDSKPIRLPPSRGSQGQLQLAWVLGRMGAL